MRLFADRAFTPSLIANVFVTFILFGGLFLLPLYLQILRGLSAYQAGLFLLPQALASMVVVLIGGRLVVDILPTAKTGGLPPSRVSFPASLEIAQTR